MRGYSRTSRSIQFKERVLIRHKCIFSLVVVPQWLKKAAVKDSMEAAIMAAQDQAVKRYRVQGLPHQTGSTVQAVQRGL